MLCPVLVGRDEEARWLRAVLTAAGTGRGSTVFLAGEAGIGKSRLVREVTRAAAENGLAVLAGRAVAGGAPTPFRPFAEALTSAGRAAGSRRLAWVPSALTAGIGEMVQPAPIHWGFGAGTPGRSRGSQTRSALSMARSRVPAARAPHPASGEFTIDIAETATYIAQPSPSG